MPVHPSTRHRPGRRALAAAVLVPVSALVLAGCGESAADAGAPAEGGATDGAADTIVLASIPSEESTSLDAQFGKVRELIESETGATVEFQTATDYAAVIEGMRAGQIDLAAFGPFSYVIAKDSGVPVEPLAAVVDAPDASPGYYSYGIVPGDSDITDLAGFRDKTVCFVDPSSTSGYLYPSAGLLEAGVDPEADVTPVMAGGHDASALSVADGTCDAGFAFDAIVDTTLIESGQLAEGDLKKVWESEEIAGSPVSMNSETLSPELQEQLRDVFQNKANVEWMVENGICTAEDCPLPEESEWGYKAVDDASFDGVRAVCDTTQAEACQVA
jgi:phosphonate transport system substrate-binding protein